MGAGQCSNVGGRESKPVGVKDNHRLWDVLVICEKVQIAR